jgi:hypothetical protein
MIEKINRAYGRKKGTTVGQKIQGIYIARNTIPEVTPKDPTIQNQHVAYHRHSGTVSGGQGRIGGSSALSLLVRLKALSLCGEGVSEEVRLCPDLGIATSSLSRRFLYKATILATAKSGSQGGKSTGDSEA